MQEDPAEALRQSFAPEAIQELATAFPEAAGLLESHGTWSGPVQTRVYDSEDFRTNRVVHRLRTGDETLEVHMGGVEPDSKCGDIVSFKGVRQAEVIAAASATVTSSATSSSCGPIGQQNVAVLLVTFPGVPPPSGVTTQSVSNAFFGTTGRSLDRYWREASYGQTWATGNVFGWYTLDALYSCSQPDAMLAAATKAADADVNFHNYSRVFLVFPNPGGCSFAGLSDIGCASYSSPADGTFTASASWVLADYFGGGDSGPQLLGHEAGHGLGLMHSRSRSFGTESLGALGAAGAIDEYGDINSAMGFWNFGHYTGPQKLSLGWQRSGTNVVTVQSSGTYLLQPTELPSAGVQTLKVQRGTGSSSWIWVEYRQPVGDYDSTLNPEIFGGALIHYQDSITGGYTDLLDYTTGTASFADAALTAGQTWVDPYSNLSLTIQSATSAGLGVAVSYGAAPCTQVNPTVSASPLNPSAYAGTNVNYTVSVTNKDSAGCASSTFGIGSTLPSNWPTLFSTSALTLSPGQSGSVTMTKSIPSGTTPAVYGVNASGADSSFTSSASANVTVMAPPPSPPPPPPPSLLYVTPSVGSSTYAPKSVVSMTAIVLSGANPAASASVVFRLTKADGSVTTKSTITDVTGKASWSYRLGPKDPTGTYSLTVTATYGSLTATGGPVTFTVR